ncbi:AprI/Inh family metalloprotease inhibitor [Pseudomonas fragi]|uniref:AprI/Inh family metalloprotease inhibitor n=1 Tax=Pseudomonas fragi TaxID=296 RepID=UPI00391800A8
MASSLLLLSPAQLAGSWTFYPLDDATHRCTVQLVAEHKTFNSEVKCLKTWLGEVPKSWSPTPDGIYLMGPDGTALVHMNRIEPGHYEAQVKTETVLVMVRNPE